MAKAKEENATVQAPAFSKQQILAAKSFTESRDLLSVILEDERDYTLDEIQKEIDAFMKKEFDKPKAKEGD